jgi:hypothetical protein
MMETAGVLSDCMCLLIISAMIGFSSSNLLNPAHSRAHMIWSSGRMAKLLETCQKRLLKATPAPHLSYCVLQC